jgi:hypothetical protein
MYASDYGYDHTGRWYDQYSAMLGGYIDHTLLSLRRQGCEDICTWRDALHSRDVEAALLVHGVDVAQALTDGAKVVRRRVLAGKPFLGLNDPVKTRDCKSGQGMTYDDRLIQLTSWPTNVVSSSSSGFSSWWVSPCKVSPEFE